MQFVQLEAINGIYGVIIQHIDTLSKYSHKTLHVRRSTWRIFSDGCKFGVLKGSEMTAACNFISLGEKKMREVLDKNGKRKKKKKREEKKRGKLLIT